MRTDTAATERAPLNRQRYILIFTVSIALVIVAVCVYLSQLATTVSSNLMSTIDEISRHDVETIERSLDSSYSRLESVANRMTVYDVTTIEEAEEQLSFAAASSTMFNTLYLLDDEGNLYSSSLMHLEAAEHTYDTLFADEGDRFVVLYNQAYGKLGTTEPSLLYGIRLEGLSIEGHRLIGLLGRSDLSVIGNQLLIESFDGQGVSSVVNSQGYFIVSSPALVEMAGRNSFYAVLDAGHIDGGITIEQIRQNISDGESFVINCTTATGERLFMSFAPVEGAEWSFVMTVPRGVFEQRFAPFIIMTAVMLITVVLVIAVMLAIIYRYMKRSATAAATAAARSEFLSNMSHEIRTPLNGIIGLNHLIERHLDDRQAVEGYVSKLGKTAQYLLSLVSDILDVSKMQAGKFTLAREPFNLTAALKNVCEMQREAIVERGIRFKLEMDAFPYPYVIGDEVRISQVLMNILSNAGKFTPPGGTITFRAHQHLLEDGAHVGTTIAVEDTGCGMSDSFREHIFDTFSQERNLNSESQKGTGLGMAISRLLMDQMGGLITVESELGKGSCFTVVFSLPLDPAHAGEMPCDAIAETGDAADGDRLAEALPAAGAGAGEGEAASAGRMRILVAEDNELNADIISSILGEEGYDVTVVEDGQAAVDAFSASEEGGFRVILMDAQMPVMDGYEAAREIRRLKRPDAGSVKIFACTASTFAEDRERAAESGMDDFLAKPLNVPVLLQKLEEVGREG